MSFKNKIVLVTGAGSGIGRETACLFAKKGATVLLVDINKQGLDETRGIIIGIGARAECHVCNVADPDAMSALADDIHSRYSALDILINNAGVSSSGRFLDTSLENWRRVMDINLMGVVHGCHYFIPRMIAEGKRGSVVNIASVAAYFAPKDQPIYSASKFAVLGFSESLRDDLSEYGIAVSVVCPGIIDTPVHHNATFEGDDDVAQRSKALNKARHAKRRYPPAKVAAGIVRAASHRGSLFPVSPEAWVLYFGKRLMPRGLSKIERWRKIG